MPTLIWDKVGDRSYESGLDKGVLYLPNGSAVPWNGLVSVTEKFDRNTSPVYYDGMKINDLVTLGDFSATMKAITYPDEFIEIEGQVKARTGLFLGNQKPQAFGLSYRTQIGNDVAGDQVSYKIHVLYNLIAVPNDKSYASKTESTNLMEFEWDITGIPEEFDGYRPTAEIIIHSAEIEPWLLTGVEAMLYGDATTTAFLPPMFDLITYLTGTYLIDIVDNGDGTWTATSPNPALVQIISTDLFQITSNDMVYLDASTYVISSTYQ